MASVLKNFLGYLKLNEDDEYDEYLENYEEEEQQTDKMELEERRFSKREKAKVKEETVIPPRKERGQRMEKSSSSKIIPIRTTTKGLEVCIMKPASFEDSQDICDMLLSGRATVVNLEGFDPTDAQRIMDFISGCVYAINGKLHQISRYIFIFSPESIDISGDYLEFLPESGFGVPTLNKEF